MIRTSRAFGSYIWTFFRLGANFISEKPWLRGGLSIANATTGLVYPVPIILVAHAISMLLSGDSRQTFDLFGRAIEVSLLGSVFAGVGTAGLIYLARYLIGIWLVDTGLGWQRGLFEQLLRLPGQLHRFDRQREYELPERRVFYGWAGRVAAAGSQIVLLFLYGLHSLAVVLVLGAIVAIISVEIFAVLAIASLLFLPIYALVLRRLLDLRRGTEGWGTVYRENYRAIVDSSAAQAPQAPTPLLPGASDGVTLVTSQHRELLGLQLVANAHAIIALASFVFLYYFLGDFTALETVVLLGSIFLMVRAGAGLVQFLGNLTRNYINIRILQSALFGTTKRLEPNCFIMLDDGKLKATIVNGGWVLVDGPEPADRIELFELAKLVVPGQRSIDCHAEPCFDWFSGVKSGAAIVIVSADDFSFARSLHPDSILFVFGNPPESCGAANAVIKGTRGGFRITN